ncbi:MAG: hypothetical protein ACI9Y8_001966, partial [Candidatus Omnitrophota bacterium]
SETPDQRQELIDQLAQDLKTTSTKVEQTLHQLGQKLTDQGWQLHSLKTTDNEDSKDVEGAMLASDSFYDQNNPNHAAVRMAQKWNLNDEVRDYLVENARLRDDDESMKLYWEIDEVYKDRTGIYEIMPVNGDKWSYRGMQLSLDALENILINGISVEDSQGFDVAYFTKIPFRALLGAFSFYQGAAGDKTDFVNVVIQVDRTQINWEEVGADDKAIEDVPADAITQIVVVDKNKNALIDITSLLKAGNESSTNSNEPRRASMAEPQNIEVNRNGVEDPIRVRSQSIDFTNAELIELLGQVPGVKHIDIKWSVADGEEALVVQANDETQALVIFKLDYGVDDSFLQLGEGKYFKSRIKKHMDGSDGQIQTAVKLSERQFWRRLQSILISRNFAYLKGPPTSKDKAVIDYFAQMGFIEHKDPIQPYMYLPLAEHPTLTQNQGGFGQGDQLAAQSARLAVNPKLWVDGPNRLEDYFSVNASPTGRYDANNALNALMDIAYQKLIVDDGNRGLSPTPEVKWEALRQKLLKVTYESGENDGAKVYLSEADIDGDELGVGSEQEKLSGDKEPLLRKIHILTQIYIDFIDELRDANENEAHVPQVIRDGLKSINAEVLPALRYLGNAWAYTLPDAEDWMVFQTSYMMKDSIFDSRIETLIKHTSLRGLMLRAGLWGWHLRLATLENEQSEFNGLQMLIGRLIQLLADDRVTSHERDLIYTGLISALIINPTIYGNDASRIESEYISKFLTPILQMYTKGVSLDNAKSIIRDAITHIESNEDPISLLNSHHILHVNDLSASNIRHMNVYNKQGNKPQYISALSIHLGRPETQAYLSQEFSTGEFGHPRLDFRGMHIYEFLKTYMNIVPKSNLVRTSKGIRIPIDAHILSKQAYANALTAAGLYFGDDLKLEFTTGAMIDGPRPFDAMELMAAGVLDSGSIIEIQASSDVLSATALVLILQYLDTAISIYKEETPADNQSAVQTRFGTSNKVPAKGLVKEINNFSNGIVERLSMVGVDVSLYQKRPNYSYWTHPQDNALRERLESEWASRKDKNQSGSAEAQSKPNRPASRMTESSEFIEFAAGDALIEQGEEGYDVYFIHEGEVVITLVLDDEDLDREPIKMATLGVGEKFGELAGLHGGFRTATVTATTNGRVEKMSLAKWKLLMSQLDEEEKKFFDKELKQRMKSVGEGRWNLNVDFPSLYSQRQAVDKAERQAWKADVQEELLKYLKTFGEDDFVRDVFDAYMESGRYSHVVYTYNQHYLEREPDEDVYLATIRRGAFALKHKKALDKLLKKLSKYPDRPWISEIRAAANFTEDSIGAALGDTLHATETVMANDESIDPDADLSLADEVLDQRIRDLVLRYAQLVNTYMKQGLITERYATLIKGDIYTWVTGNTVGEALAKKHTHTHDLNDPDFNDIAAPRMSGGRQAIQLSDAIAGSGFEKLLDRYNIRLGAQFTALPSDPNSAYGFGLILNEATRDLIHRYIIPAYSGQETRIDSTITLWFENQQPQYITSSGLRWIDLDPSVQRTQEALLRKRIYASKLAETNDAKGSSDYVDQALNAVKTQVNLAYGFSLSSQQDTSKNTLLHQRVVNDLSNSQSKIGQIGMTVLESSSPFELRTEPVSVRRFSQNGHKFRSETYLIPNWHITHEQIDDSTYAVKEAPYAGGEGEYLLVTRIYADEDSVATKPIGVIKGNLNSDAPNTWSESDIRLDSKWRRNGLIKSVYKQDVYPHINPGSKVIADIANLPTAIFLGQDIWKRSGWRDKFRTRFLYLRAALWTATTLEKRAMGRSAFELSLATPILRAIVAIAELYPRYAFSQQTAEDTVLGKILLSSGFEDISIRNSHNRGVAPTPGQSDIESINLKIYATKPARMTQGDSHDEALLIAANVPDYALPKMELLDGEEPLNMWVADLK